MNPMRSVMATTLAAVSLTASVAAAPAASAQTGSFTLSLFSHLTSTTRTVTLTCDPTGGTHPDGDAACADLTTVGGDIALLPLVPRVCPSFVEPVTAQAQGTWLGAPRSYSKDFPNSCYANAFTGGHVFNF